VLKGQIVMLNDERECTGGALKMLGYSYNTTDPAQLEEATQKLIDQKPLVRSYDSVSTKRRVMEGTPVVMGWTGDDLMAIDAMGGYDDPSIKALVKMNLPAEGTASWVDCLAIPSGYRSKYAAHLFIDYLLDPKVMGTTSSWTWYLPVEMVAAKPYTDEFVFINNPTPEYLAGCETIEDLGNFSRAYTEAWSKVKSS
jgi:spermidine/putrescine transport system substrate-binding protein